MQQAKERIQALEQAAERARVLAAEHEALRGSMARLEGEVQELQASMAQKNTELQGLQLALAEHTEQLVRSARYEQAVEEGKGGRGKGDNKKIQLKKFINAKKGK